MTSTKFKNARTYTVLLSVLMLLSILVIGCQKQTQEQEKIDVSKSYPDERPDIARGKQVFETYCIFCHGINGNGEGVTQNVLKEPPCNFTDRSFVRRHSPRQFFDALTNGLENAMPGFAKLPEQDRWDVLFYERTFALDQNDVKKGEAIYKKNCIQCHGEAGDGRGKAGENFKTPPRDYRNLDFQVSKSDKNLVQVMTDGLGDMPSFKTTLSEEEMYQAVSFIRTFGYKGRVEDVRRPQPKATEDLVN